MTSSGYPEGHALLIGVADYERITSLPAAVRNDVDDLSAMLSSPDSCGYADANVVKLVDSGATRAAVLKALDDLADRAGPDDTACVLFSGHGAVLGTAGEEDSVLLTFDSDLAQLDSTGISSDAFASALRRIKAKRLLVFIDACHAGGAAIAKSLVDDKGHQFKSGYSSNTFAKLAIGRGRALMASCRVDEESSILRGARNSVFTTALLSGLSGAADTGGTGFIRVFDLFSYVAEQVPRLMPGDQHPVFQADQLEGNFPVALSRGGKKSLTGSSLPHAADQNSWNVLETVLIEVYPSGPRDQEVWSRAGGDISRLQLHASGQASWHAAIRTLKQGGGGRTISFASLLAVAKDDFPNHPNLAGLATN